MDDLPADPASQYDGILRMDFEQCSQHLAELPLLLNDPPFGERWPFHEGAAQLVDRTRGLLQTCQNIERWSNECNAELDGSIDALGVVNRCTLPAGHHGDHTATDGPVPEDAIRERARQVAAMTNDVSDRLAWLAVDIDHGVPADPRDQPTNPAGMPTHPTDELASLRNLLVRIARHATNLAAVIPKLHPGVEVGRHHLPNPQSARNGGLIL